MISPLADKVMLTHLHHGAANGPITRVVIHATVSPCKRGGAEANALYFQSPSAGGAAHYIVDPGEIVCSLDEDTLGFHAPPNAGSIGIELCDPQTGDEWGDADHQAMLQLAAALTADVCARHQLPLVWRPPDQLRAGNSGITSHANVAQAWHKTDHTDPGPYFPTDQFMALVTSNTPAPPTTEDDMPGKQFKLPDGTIVVIPANGGKPWVVPGAAGPTGLQALIDEKVVEAGAWPVTDQTQADHILALTK
jgi:hypothetical protein